MGYKLSPVGHGKHNNIHFKFTIKYQKMNIVSSNIIAFENTGKAYITSLTIKGIEKHIINLDNLYKSIAKGMSSYDFELVILDKQKFFNTEELLEYLNGNDN